MSSKQLRKLQARQATKDAAEDGAEESEETDAEAHEPTASATRAGFAMLANSSSDESAEADLCDAVQERRQPAPKTAPKAKSKKAKRKGRKDRDTKTATEDAAGDDDVLLASAVAAAAVERVEDVAVDASSESLCAASTMNKADFSAERERRRLVGSDGTGERGSERRKAAVRARGETEGRFAHYRRLFLVEPSADERWPRPDGCAAMVRCDGVNGPLFQIHSTTAHRSIRNELESVQMTHDPVELQRFIVEHPFCIEALLLFSDIVRSGGDHDKAFDVIRRAAYAVECSFEAGFSPFVPTCGGCAWPRVRLELPTDDPSWAGWAWLGALWGYMLGLSAQGLHRTAVEVCRLLLAMTLPRDPLHLMVHFDYLCLRAQDFKLLSRVAVGLLVPLAANKEGHVMRLDLLLPNFAYSVALALGRQLNQGGCPSLSALQLVTVSDVTSLLTGGSERQDEEPEDAAVVAHAALMRALFLFAHVLQPLLEAASVKLDSRASSKSTSQRTWRELLARPPFLGFAEYRHHRHSLAHALISDSYAHQCAGLWRGEPTTWLHACASRLVNMCESSLFAGELMEARRRWAQAHLGPEGLLADFKDFSSAETSEERAAPDVVQRSMRFEVVSVGSPGVDEEASLQRALELSRQFDESRQNVALREEQDAELRESLAMDRARETSSADAPSDAVTEEAVGRLKDMGFHDDESRRALTATGGDVADAISMLLS